MRPHGARLGAILLLLAAGGASDRSTATGWDVPFLETPDSVVDAMLELAEVGEGDVVYDLGSGDGRIVIAAGTRGARGIGIEWDAELVARSTERVEEAGVADRVSIVQGDFFDADLTGATVVTMYLSVDVNARLAPMLAERLAPGTRVVSHRYEIRGWKPVRRIKVEGRSVFLYVVPAR